MLDKNGVVIATNYDRVKRALEFRMPYKHDTTSAYWTDNGRFYNVFSYQTVIARYDSETEVWHITGYANTKTIARHRAIVATVIKESGKPCERF